MVNVNLINATPHEVTIFAATDAAYDSELRAYKLIDSDAEPMLSIEPSGILLRCTQSEVEAGTINGIPCFDVAYGEVEGLPEAQEGTYYIVSALAANAGRSVGRKDLLTVVRMVRSEDGRRILGCLALSANG